MRLTLPSRLISALAATAVALTTFTAAPAYADNNRNARAIATILGLAVVGKIIHDNRKDEKKKKRLKRKKQKAYKAEPPRYVRPEPPRRVRPEPPRRTWPEPPRREQPGVHRHGELTHSHRQGEYRHDHRYTQPAPRPLPRRVDRKQLPKECFRSYDTRNGPTHMFAQRCLERSYQYVDRMPQECAQSVRTRDGTRRGYDARCLRRNGYSLSRG